MSGMAMAAIRFFGLDQTTPSPSPSASPSRSASPSPSLSASPSPSRSASPSVSPSGTPSPSGSPGTPGPVPCRVAYTANTWNNGFTANVIVTNTGPSTINGWTVQWTWPGNQQVTNGWNATVTQTGNQVTARNAAWNPTIGPNQNVTFGFQATYSGTNAAPTRFTLNGTACA
jgi:beta-glucosidase